MKVSRGVYKLITGEIKKIARKQVSSEKQFLTPGCIRSAISPGTIHCELVLVQGASTKGQFSSDKLIIIEPEIELVFFEFPPNKGNDGESLTVGKNINFIQVVIE